MNKSNKSITTEAPVKADAAVSSETKPVEVISVASLLRTVTVLPTGGRNKAVFDNAVSVLDACGFALDAKVLRDRRETVLTLAGASVGKERQGASGDASASVRSAVKRAIGKLRIPDPDGGEKEKPDNAARRAWAVASGLLQAIRPEAVSFASE